MVSRCIKVTYGIEMYRDGREREREREREVTLVARRKSDGRVD